MHLPEHPNLKRAIPPVSLVSGASVPEPQGLLQQCRCGTQPQPKKPHHSRHCTKHNYCCQGMAMETSMAMQTVPTEIQLLLKAPSEPDKF